MGKIRKEIFTESFLHQNETDLSVKKRLSLRWSIRILLVIILILAAIFWWQSEKKSLQPDILLISIDTLRADHLGCYGYPSAITPTIDKLAREGILFEEAMSPVPITAPAHATMLTGLIPPYHGVRSNGDYCLPEKIETVAEVLKKEGYQTGAFVSGFPMIRSSGLGQGFDYYDDKMPRRSLNIDGDVRRGERYAGEVFSSATKWLHKADPRKPVFAFIHLFDPHNPYVKKMPGSSSPSYDGEIAYVDRMLGLFLSGLKDKRWQSMITILTSDHGEGLNEHGEETHCFFVYQSTLRVPLIIHGLQNYSPERISDPVGLIDVAPSIMEIAGTRLQSEIDGKSLLNISDEAGAELRSLYFESLYPQLKFGWAPLRGIRRGGDKFIEAPRRERYHLLSDPHELDNIYRGEKNVAGLFLAELEKIKTRAEVHSKMEADSEAIEILESLGYVSAPPSKRSETEELKDPKDGIEVIEKFHKAHTLFLKGRIDESLVVYAELEPELQDSAHFYNHWGFVASRGEYWLESIDHYRKCLALDETRQGARLNLGIGLWKTNLPSEALAEFERLLAQNPNHAEASLYAGLIVGENFGDSAGAILHLKKFLAAAPDHPQADVIRKEVSRLEGL